MSGSGQSTRPWYEKAFGEFYDLVYSHRSDEEAGQIIEKVAASIDFSGKTVIDVACGNGRFLRALGESPRLAVGIDLSPELLAAARERSAGEQYALIRADMREIPIMASNADVVLLMFTSFGYFESIGENQRVLGEIARILVPGGWLVLDYLNRSWVVDNLESRSVRERDGVRIEEERRVLESGGKLVKRVCISKGGETVGEYRELLHLFSPRTIDLFLGESGLSPQERFGSEQGDSFHEKRSTRYIVVARKTGDEA